jgi:multidrug efflux pump
MNISEPFVRGPVATSLLMAAIGFVGLVAIPFLAVAPLPQVDFPTISLNALLQGASAETMAASVAAPLERQLGQIPGVTQLTSMSTLSGTSITIQFDLNRNIDSAAQDVQAAITVAGRTLPQQMSTPPSYKKVNPADSPIMVLGAQSDTLPLITVDDYADNFLAQQISQVRGVAQVLIGGEQHPAIRIQVDPAKLASSGLTLEDVRSMLVNSTTIAAKGTLNTERTSFTIAANDQIIDPAPFEDVVLAYRNGGPIRVRDVGTAVAGPTDRTVAAWQNGTRSILLYVFKQPGANVDRNSRSDQGAAAAADQKHTAGDQHLGPAGPHYHDPGLGGGCRVHFGPDHCAGGAGDTAVPSQSLGHGHPRYHRATGAAGIVRDDVSLEFQPRQPFADGTHHLGWLCGRRRHRGGREYSPSHRGRQIAVPGGAYWLARDRLHGVVDQLLADRSVHPAAADERDYWAAVSRIRLTVTASIAVSALVSLTLAPMLCSRFMRPQSHTPGRVYRVIEGGFDVMLSFYQRTLNVVLHHQRITLFVFFATMALTGWMMYSTPKGFFPIQDIGLINGISEGAQAEIDRIILEDPGVEGIASQVGTTYGAQTTNTGRFNIMLKPREDRDLDASQIIDRLRPRLTKIIGATAYLQPAQDITVGGRIARAAFQYTLQDPNINELTEWAGKLLDKLKAVPEIIDVGTDLLSSAPQLKVTINRDDASRFGISAQAIDDTLNDAFGQRQITQYFTQLNTYWIILEVLPDMLVTLDTLDHIYVKSPTTGSAVPLSAVVDLDSYRIGPLSINHQGQFPSATLTLQPARWRCARAGRRRD